MLWRVFFERFLYFGGYVCVFYSYMNVVLDSCVRRVYMWCGYLVKGTGWMVEGCGEIIVVVIGGCAGRGSS